MVDRDPTDFDMVEHAPLWDGSRGAGSRTLLRSLCRRLSLRNADFQRQAKFRTAQPFSRYEIGFGCHGHTQLHRGQRYG